MAKEICYKLTSSGFETLFSSFQQEGYKIVGPTIKDQAIVYGELEKVGDLPIGWTDEQGPGYYRVKKRTDRAYFGYNAGPHSWKKYLFPARRKLWQASRSKDGIAFVPGSLQGEKRVFLGVRSCEIAAIRIQDKVFIGGKYVDPYYKNQRSEALIVAVNCTQAAPTCFCSSMHTGPEVKEGFDLALTEVVSEREHFFVAAAGSEAGERFLQQLQPGICTKDEQALAKAGLKRAKDQMAEGLGMDTGGINHLLYRNLDHTRWDEVAKRCLSCANCTLVCPTCFCSNTEEVTDLTGDHTERWKTWDSCFNLDHSHLHGGSVRSSTKSRYRQWLTHKVGSWIDQFGESGCVGCGRCIAWCPVGIDLREEIQAIRETDKGGEEGREGT